MRVFLHGNTAFGYNFLLYFVPVFPAVSAASLSSDMILLATNPFGISALACAFMVARTFYVLT